MPIPLPDHLLSYEQLEEKLKNNKPPGPPFDPLKKYVNETIINEISIFIVDIIEESARKIGYVVRKGKKEELRNSVFESIYGWGPESHFAFSCIDTSDFVRKTLFKTIASIFYWKSKKIVSCFSGVVEDVLVQLDIPEVKKWLYNSYKPYKTYKEYKRMADFELRMHHNSRLSENHSNASSSPISDKRLKDNIRPISDALSRVLLIRGVEYIWRENEFGEIDFTGLPTIGLIAQDLEKLEPSLVYINDNGYKAIHYGNVVSLLVEAIKEQQAQIHDLKTGVRELRKTKIDARRLRSDRVEQRRANPASG